MSSTSSIEWTGATWNPVAGCTPVSPGCLNCYAATLAGTRLKGRAEYVGLTVRRGVAHSGEAGDHPGDPRDRHVFNGKVRCLPERLSEPLRWRRARMIFVNSMSDLFHEAVPAPFIWDIFAVMAIAERHTFQVLTKRPERMAEVLTDPRAEEHLEDACNRLAARRGASGPMHMAGEITLPLPNAWLGTSCENQATAAERIPHLLRCPAAVRFLSLEPLVGPVNWRLAMCNCPWPADAMQSRHLMSCPVYDEADRGSHIHWVIAGGESGANARPCRLSWIRSIVQQCRTARVPVFVKQVGSRPVPIKLDAPAGAEAGSFYRISDKSGRVMADWPDDLRVREFPREAVPA